MKPASFFVRGNFFAFTVLTAFFLSLFPGSTYAKTTPPCDNFRAGNYTIVNNGGSQSFALGENIQTALTLSTKDATKNLYDSDIVLVMDRSTSMDGDKLVAAKNALREVVRIVANSSNPGTRIALVTFSAEATLDQNLTTNYNAVNVAINSITTSPWTTIGGGLVAAAGVLNLEPIPVNKKRFIILASDGRHNNPPGVATGIALIPPDVTVYTVGIGSDMDPILMKAIASGSGAKNGLFFASVVTDLVAIFGQITSEIMGYFTLTDIELGFTREDVVHTTLSSTAPNYSNYEPVNGVITWKEFGDLQNGRGKIFTINYSAKNIGSSVILNTDTLKVTYMNDGISCVDTVPVNRLMLTIADISLPVCTDVTWEWEDMEPVHCTTSRYTQVSNCGSVRERNGTTVCSQCADSIDNDKDGKTDYPLDSGCWNGRDNSEHRINIYNEF